MKKRLKKVIVIVLVIGILAGSTCGGVMAYQNYRKENLTAEVVSVESLNWGYSEDNMTSSGYVSNDYVQNVYAEDKVITEILVKEGDEVEIGTPLLTYDTTEAELQLEMKQLEIQGIENDIILAKRELERLKTITPVPDDAIDNDTGIAEEPEEPANDMIVSMQIERKSGDAYNYIDGSAKPYTGSGSVKDPYRFVCAPECYVTGAYLNQLVKEEQTAAFEIWSGNSREHGTLVSCWTVDGADMTAVDEESKWLVATQNVMEEEIYVQEEESDDTDMDVPDDTSEEVTYTVSELKDAISDKESELKDLDIKKRSEEISLKKAQRDMDKGTITATIKGVVKKAADLENLPADGSAIVEVSSTSGLYVTGEISELLLTQIKVGQDVSASSWNTSQTYTATITEISPYPSENNGGYYGEGNSNVSYYAFTAYIENPEGLVNGDYVDLSMQKMASEANVNGLYIDKAYVREENGKHYVYKAGEDDRLVKQYIQTGKTVWGSAIEIKSGLSGSDRIAFPYGKTAKEGIHVVDSEY